MKKPLQNLSLGLGAVFCGLMLGMTQQPSPTSTVDTAKIADTIVNESANIRYDELVLISGATRDQQLLEDIAVVVRKLGAHPLIAIGSDRLTRNLFTQVPTRFDAQEPKIALRMAEIVDAMISVDSSGSL